ncbi:MAG: hypothetical protein VX935_12205 [Pseudomonadota bacterium]|jgi:hypothetical protein|nr:hypothetical protein [Pseudomonadota bacterium]
MDFLTVTASGTLAVLVQVVAWYWLKERLSRSIKHEYDVDMESFRHDLELDLDKKKRLYEGKLSQYKKYFKYIDESSESARDEVFSDLGEKMIDLIRDPSEKNTLAYIQSTLISQRDIGDRFLKFRNEINGLRLEAGENLLKLLDSYTEALEEVQKETVGFMERLNNNPLRFMQENTSVQQEIAEFMKRLRSGAGARTKKIKDEIFWEMRRELGII